MEKRPIKNDRLAKVTSIEKKLLEKSKERIGSGRNRKEKTQINTTKIKRMMLVIFVVLLIIIVVKGIFGIRNLREQEQEVQLELENKLAEKEKLEQQKEYINSEEYIEQAARDMLKMIRPGEILFVLKDDSILDEKDETQEKTNDEGKKK